MNFQYDSNTHIKISYTSKDIRELIVNHAREQLVNHADFNAAIPETEAVISAYGLDTEGVEDSIYDIHELHITWLYSKSSGGELP